MIQEKKRVIQEYVPGKQLTLAHIIANPLPIICEQLGLEEQSESIGVMTITPGEAAIIAADTATKAAGVDIGYVDRFGGSLVVTGDVASVEAAVDAVRSLLENVLQFTVTDITRS